MAVRPAAAACSAAATSGVTSTPRAAISARLPTRTARPSTAASTPWPGTASNECSAGTRRPRSAAAPTIAWATGCSLPASAAATRASTASSVQPAVVLTDARAGVPRVIVPVLSSTTAVTRRAVSSASPLPMRMPSSAARPVPTMTAVGVASPSAQGQAMISTAIVVVIAIVSPPVSGPNSAQATKVAAASSSTIGTNQVETRSASRCIGTFAPCASSTSRTIWASAVSSPTAVARMTTVPVRLRVAPMTWSPAALSTGRLSPVSMLSSTAVAPSVTTPSTGTFSPGRIRTRSPTTTCSTGTSTSAPPRSARAVFGVSPTRAVIAAAVRFLARSSIHRPASTSARITSDVSK